MFKEIRTRVVYMLFIGKMVRREGNGGAGGRIEDRNYRSKVNSTCEEYRLSLGFKTCQLAMCVSVTFPSWMAISSESGTEIFIAFSSFAPLGVRRGQGGIVLKMQKKRIGKRGKVEGRLGVALQFPPYMLSSSTLRSSQDTLSSAVTLKHYLDIIIAEENNLSSRELFLSIY